jgi:hypothetical protein
MLNRVNDVFVTNTTGANTGTTVATAVAGDILILNRAMEVVSAPIVAVSDKLDVFYIAKGVGAGQVVLSNPIQTKNLTKVTRSGYSAAVELVKAIGYNGTSGALNTPLDSTEYQLNLVFLDDQRPWSGERQTRRSFSYVTSASATQDEIAQAFVDAINADTFASTYVTAAKLSSGSDRGIQITGKVIPDNSLDLHYQVNFDCSLFPYVGIYAGTAETVSTVTAKAWGNGTYSLVRDLEEASLAYYGKTNRIQFPIDTTPAISATVGNTYNITTLEYFNEHTGDQQKQMKSPMSTVVAFHSASAPTKSTKETTFVDIIESIAEIMGLTFVE